jgi:glycosyltransferase involved in cell wall biosynthesis
LARRALGSILSQTLESLDVIVVDDSPSADLARALTDLLDDARVRYFPGARTGNAADNWNLGLSLAWGRWSVVIHHDEALADPGFLERAAHCLQNEPGRALLTRTAAPGPRRRFAFAHRLAALAHAPAWTLYLANWAGPTAAIVFPTDAGLRFDPRLAWLTDVDFYARLWRHTGPFLRDDVIAVISIAHPRQITAQIDPIAAHRQELALLARLGDERLAAWQIALVGAGLGLKRLAKALG